MAARIRALRMAYELGRPTAGSHLDPPASFETWKKWENDETRPSPDHLLALANFFNVSADYLLGRTDDILPTGKSPDARDVLADPSSAAAEAAALAGGRQRGHQRLEGSRGSRKRRPGSSAAR